MKRFKNILIVCSEDGNAANAVERGLWLAQANGAKVTLLDLIETGQRELGALFSALPAARAKEVEALVIQQYEDRLAGFSEQFSKAGIDVVTSVQHGVGFVEVIRTVLRGGHDLVIKAAAPGATDSLIFASNDMHLMRKCPCPVWMLKDGQPPTTERILAAVDPENNGETTAALNKAVLELGTSLAERDGAELHVLGAWRLQSEGALRRGRVTMSETEITSILASEARRAKSRMTSAIEQVPGAADADEIVLEKGFAGDVIPAYAESHRIDTIVMGTVGRTGIAGLFIGNTAETILNAARCSVMAIKPPGFQTPIALANDP